MVDDIYFGRKYNIVSLASVTSHRSSLGSESRWRPVPSTLMQPRMLVTMLIYSNATAAEMPQMTTLQPVRKQNQLKTLLHSSSSAALADVNFLYNTNARPIDERMDLHRTRHMGYTLLIAAEKTPHARLPGGACTGKDRDVLPTLSGRLAQVVLFLAEAIYLVACLSYSFALSNEFIDGDDPSISRALKGPAFYLLSIAVPGLMRWLNTKWINHRADQPQSGSNQPDP